MRDEDLMPLDEDLMTLDEAAEGLGISKKTLRRRLVEADISGLRPGREMLLSRAHYRALLRFLATRPPPAPRRKPHAGPSAEPPPPRRGPYRGQTGRLLDRITGERPVVALELERDKLH